MMDIGFFFINLDRADDRCARMAQNAVTLGLAFQRVPAVDLTRLGDTPPRNFDPCQYRHERWTLRAFEIAVFESHRKAWQTFLDSCHDLAVIMEDDLLFSPDFARQVERLSEASANFDIVKLNHSTQPRRLGRALVGLTRLALHPIQENIADAGGYLITRTAAKSLLEQSKSYCSHLDDFVFSPDRRLRALQLIPPVCAQMIYFVPPAQRADKAISVRLTLTEAAKKGPLRFRIWKELRRLIKRAIWRTKSTVNGGQQVDMSALLADFVPIQKG